MKTKEEKSKYCRQWRVKNREKYLEKRRVNYQKNINQYREEAKRRAYDYYYKVVVPKRKKNPMLYKTLDREHSIKRRNIRKNHLRELRERMGGKCSRCGFTEVMDVLQFHHQGKKEDNVGNIQSYKKREKEAKKCILLCPNCHAMEHLSK